MPNVNSAPIEMNHRHDPVAGADVEDDELPDPVAFWRLARRTSIDRMSDSFRPVPRNADQIRNR